MTRSPAHVRPVTERPAAVPLVPWPRAAWAVVTVSALVVAVLGVAFHGQDRGTALDVHVARWISAHVPYDLVQAWLGLSNPYLSTMLVVLTAAGAWLVGARRAAVFAAVAPIVCVIMTEFVLKPAIHRTNLLVTAGLGREVTAYPSGHETGVGSIMIVLAVLVLRSSRTAAVKAAVVGLVVVHLLLTGVALVGGYYHYATDIVGAIGVVLVCVLGTGLLIDRCGLPLRFADRPAPRAPR